MKTIGMKTVNWINLKLFRLRCILYSVCKPKLKTGTIVATGKNNILIAITLLIFIGQANVSSVIACSMMLQPMPQIDHQMMSGMNHSNHSMNKMKNSDNQSMASMQDCCDNDSNCSMSGCVTVAVTSDILLQSTEFIQHSIISDYSMAPRQSLSSLYRPPIFS